MSHNNAEVNIKQIENVNSYSQDECRHSQMADTLWVLIGEN